jgi:hypothetical protein
MKLTSIAILTAACCLAGCTLPSTSPFTPRATGITGNWEITLASTTRAPIVYSFGTYLTQSGSTVSGVGSWAHDAFPLCIGGNGFQCGYPFIDLNPNVVGTIDANGNVAFATATSTQYPGTLTINANVPSDGTLSGTYTITYSTNVEQGTLSANMIAPLNGTYTGTVVSSLTGQSMVLTTTLTQSSLSGGFLPFSGTASFTGASCFGSAAIPASGSFLGNQLEIYLVPVSSPATTILLDGTLSPDAKTLAVTYNIGGACTNDSGSGTLTRQ